MKRDTFVSIFALLALLSCNNREADTTLVVTVVSDLSFPSQIDAVGIVIGGGKLRYRFALGDSGTQVKFPVRVAVVRGNDGVGEFDVEASGYLNAGLVVTQSATVAFVQGEVREIVLSLKHDCKSVVNCGADTCEHGACVPKSSVGIRRKYSPELVSTFVDGGVKLSTDSGYPDAETPAGVGGMGGSMFSDAAIGNGGTGGQVSCAPHVANVSVSVPSVVVVMDRSGSMMRNAAGQCVVPSATCAAPSPGMTRWSIAKNAIDSVIGSTEQTIAWGMKLYPTCKHPPGNANPFLCEYPVGISNGCAIEGGDTAPAINQQNTISTTLGRETPAQDAGGTPTAIAVAAGVQILNGIKNDNPKFMLLVTDGEPNCDTFTGNNCPAGVDCSSCAVGQPCMSINGSMASIRAVQDAAAAGVPVFVLGFAIPDPGANNPAHITLNAMAVAGGLPVNNATYKYYNADDQASLAKALNEIAATTVSCTFALDAPPPEDAVTLVTVDNQPLPNGTMDGWSFSSGRNAIIFNGTACARLKAGDFKKTAVTFDCRQ
jgi:hypothetical protein